MRHGIDDDVNVNLSAAIMQYVAVAAAVYFIMKQQENKNKPDEAEDPVKEEKKDEVKDPVKDETKDEHKSDGPPEVKTSDPIFQILDGPVAVAVLFRGNGFTGESLQITLGRSIEIAHQSTSEACGTQSASLDCWLFDYRSVRVNSALINSFRMHFTRTISGTVYTLTLDPSKTGSLPVLSGSVLESYVPANSYLTTDAMAKTAALPYGHWKAPLFVRFAMQ